MEELGDLSSHELTQVLTGLDRTLDQDNGDVPPDLENLTPSQLQTLLRSLET